MSHRVREEGEQRDEMEDREVMLSVALATCGGKRRKHKAQVSDITLQNMTVVCFVVTEVNNANYFELNLFPDFSFSVEMMCIFGASFCLNALVTKKLLLNANITKF